jgi:hypothetical protein
VLTTSPQLAQVCQKIKNKNKFNQSNPHETKTMIGKLNIEINFPILILVGGTANVYISKEEYTICKREHIEILKQVQEILIDAQGNSYTRTEIIPLENINKLNGFSMKHLGFGYCYVERNVAKLTTMTATELKIEAKQLLQWQLANKIKEQEQIQRLAPMLDTITEREDILRYLFYFAEPSYFETPLAFVGLLDQQTTIP